MPFILKKYYPWRSLVFVLGELLLIFFIINALFVFSAGVAAYREIFFIYVLRAAVVACVFLLCFYYFDLYNLSSIPKFSEHAFAVVQAFGFGCIILAVVYFFFPHLTISTRIFWAGLAVVGVAILFWRFWYFKILEKRLFTKPIAIIGTGRAAREIFSTVENNKASGFQIVAFVGKNNPGSLPADIPFYGAINELYDLCAMRGIEKIILAPDDRRGMRMHDLIQYKFMGIEILDVVKFYEDLTGKIMVEEVNPSWLLFSEGFYVGAARRIAKRTLDLSAASVMLLLTFPVFFLCALVIKLESPGGVFYRQERVGRYGRVFTVIKFRSMYDNAETNGPVWAQSEDDRVTKFGRLIRKLRIDELPQLINVLKGEMSFVGPRPERPVFVKDLEKSIPFYTIRHMVKPGITGWAQICYPYGASEEDALRKLEYDLYYIKNLSIGMDLSTIFQTIKVVLFQKGAR